MEPEARAIAIDWLNEMQFCVRTVDFTRCRSIFAPGVVGFGTRIDAAIGLDALERDQWRHVWGRIRNFTFLTGQLHGGIFGAGLWLACPWTSEGRNSDGEWRTRPGRITAALERRDDRWLAVHTHHSVVPDASTQPRPDSDVVIRRARPGEGAALGALTVRSKAHWGYDDAFMTVARKDLSVSEESIVNDDVHVFESDGRVLAYCHFRPGEDDALWLESLFVEPDAIGTGLGRRLFEFAARNGRELGFGAMTFESDPNAEPFYLALGAVRTGVIASTLIPGRMLPVMRFDLAKT